MIIDPNNLNGSCKDNTCSDECQCGIKFIGSVLTSVPDGYKMDFSNMFISSTSVFFKNVLIPKHSLVDLTRYLDPNTKLCIMMSSNSIPGSDSCECHSHGSDVPSLPLYYTYKTKWQTCSISVTVDVNFLISIDSNIIKIKPEFKIGNEVISDFLYKSATIKPGTNQYNITHVGMYEEVSILNSIDIEFIDSVNMKLSYKTIYNGKFVYQKSEIVPSISITTPSFTSQHMISSPIYSLINPLGMISENMTELKVNNPNDSDAMLSLMLLN